MRTLSQIRANRQVLTIICLLVLLSGCRSTPYFGFPEFGPVDAQTQRRRAARFDPFPDPNIGPGAQALRPREYQEPTPFKNAPDGSWLGKRNARNTAEGNDLQGQTCPRPVPPPDSYRQYASPVNRSSYVRPDCEPPVYLPPQTQQNSCPRQPSASVPEGYRSSPTVCF